MAPRGGGRRARGVAGVRHWGLIAVCFVVGLLAAAQVRRAAWLGPKQTHEVVAIEEERLVDVGHERRQRVRPVLRGANPPGLNASASSTSTRGTPSPHAPDIGAGTAPAQATAFADRDSVPDPVNRRATARDVRPRFVRRQSSTSPPPTTPKTPTPVRFAPSPPPTAAEAPPTPEPLPATAPGGNRSEGPPRMRPIVVSRHAPPPPPITPALPPPPPPAAPTPSAEGEEEANDQPAAGVNEGAVEAVAGNAASPPPPSLGTRVEGGRGDLRCGGLASDDVAVGVLHSAAAQNSGWVLRAFKRSWVQHFAHTLVYKKHFMHATSSDYVNMMRGLKTHFPRAKWYLLVVSPTQPKPPSLIVRGREGVGSWMLAGSKATDTLDGRQTLPRMPLSSFPLRACPAMDGALFLSGGGVW